MVVGAVQAKSRRARKKVAYVGNIAIEEVKKLGTGGGPRMLRVRARRPVFLLSVRI